MTVPNPRDEAMRLADVITADEAQVATLTASIDSLTAALDVVRSRLADSKARLRVLQRRHYAGLEKQAQAS